MSGSLYADSVGAKTAVIFATQVEGFQIAATAASLAADVVGIEVLARIDVPAEQPSYRAEAEKIADLAPDVVIVQAGGVESATLINETAEAGASLHWIGETGWVIPEFLAALGAEGVAAQQSVGFRVAQRSGSALRTPTPHVRRPPPPGAWIANNSPETFSYFTF